MPSASGRVLGSTDASSLHPPLSLLRTTNLLIRILAALIANLADFLVPDFVPDLAVRALDYGVSERCGTASTVEKNLADFWHI